MSGLVHFSRYLTFVEIAEHELLQTALGNPFLDCQGERLGWPRLSISCNYNAPLTFGDKIQTHLSFKKLGPAKITYAFEIYKGTILTATGSVTIGCCREQTDALVPIVIPDPMLEKIRSSCNRRNE